MEGRIELTPSAGRGGSMVKGRKAARARPTRWNTVGLYLCILAVLQGLGAQRGLRKGWHVPIVALYHVPAGPTGQVAMAMDCGYLHIHRAQMGRLGATAWPKARKVRHISFLDENDHKKPI